MKRLIFTFLFCSAILSFAQELEVPKSYSNIQKDESGLFLEMNGERFYAEENATPQYSLEQLFGNPKGTEQGVLMDFGDFEGKITYGLIPYGKAPHPLPVFRFEKKLENGKASINIKDDFKYPYDFVDWQNNQKLSIGYRLTNADGMVVYDGEVSLQGNGPFPLYLQKPQYTLTAKCWKVPKEPIMKSILPIYFPIPNMNTK